jgi:hypothetical protein
MSMVELDAELTRFIHELEGFNNRIAQRWDEMQRTYERAEELWPLNDSTRRDFEAQWGELANVLRYYREQQGQRYLDFLLLKKRALDRYFGR